MRTIEEKEKQITESIEEKEEQSNKEVEEQDNEMQMGKASRRLHRRFHYTADDLYNEFISGNKASLRNLFNKKVSREEKIRLAREFVWGVGLLYKIIQMKVNFIVDGFRIYHEDKDVLKTFKELNEELDMEEYIKNAAFEHEVVGEWYPFLSWNGTDLKKLTILNPEQVKVKSLFGENLIFLKPTKEIRKLLNDPDEEVQKRVRDIVPRKYYEKWSKGQEVLLEEEEVDRYFNQKAYHEGYSHSPIEPIFDDLALLSMYKESDYSVAYKIKKAILQIKVGHKDYNDGDAVGKKMLDQAEELFDNPSESAEVFTQWFMDAEWLIPDADVYYPDKYEPVVRSILEWSGLAVFLSQDSTYSGGDIKAEGFYRDVKAARKEIKKSVREIYKKIAKKKGMKTYGDKLKYPKVKFSDANLQSNENMIESIKFLYKHGLVSPDTTLDLFGFDFDEEYDIKTSDDKMDKYLEVVTVPFEPSQDVNMRSERKNEIDREMEMEFREQEDELDDENEENDTDDED